MKFHLAHTNINVANLERSQEFYEEALGLREIKRKEGEDGSFTLVYLSDEEGRYAIELTCLTGHPEPYDLGENEIHIAFHTDDFAAAHAKHAQMGCICFENHQMGIYFINDPDGYWLEILPQK